MSEDEAFHLVHTLSLFLFLAGIGATLRPLFRAWNSDDLHAQVFAFREAARNHTGILLPGLILVGITGAFWAIRSVRVDPVETGWLLTVEVLYLIILFVCFPGMTASLRRVRILALHAEKTGAMTPELQDTIADRGPIVFGTLMAILVIVITVLAVTKPY